MQQSEAATAFREIGDPNEAQRFFTNRMDYYRENNAGWQLDENLFTSWVGAVNFCSLLRSMKAPPLLGSGQKSEFLMQHKGDDLRSLHSTLGIDPMSAEYLDMMGDWLKDFTETLAKIITESNSAYLSALNSVKEEDASAVKTMKAYKAICIVLALWCVVLLFMDFDQVWIYQITRIAVTIVAVFLAIVLRGWQKVVAILVGILFNPLIPIDFDRQAWVVVDVATAIFLIVVGFWPSPHYAKKPNKMATPRKPSD
jgi:hypothetical protein